MAIDTKDMKIVTSLFELGKAIREEYDKIGTEEYSKEKLLGLLDREDALLNSMILSQTKVYSIEDAIRDKIGAYLRSDLPLGINPFMADVTYHYIRLISRLRYKLKEQSMVLDQFTTANQIDLEIGLFYNSLLLGSTMFEDVSESLIRFSKRILIDSPRIERAVIENDMQSLEDIDDCLPFQINAWGAYHTKVSGGQALLPAWSNITTKRLFRYDYLMKEICELFQENRKSCKNGQIEKKGECMMCISYIKAIVATLDEKRRHKIYMDFVDDNASMFRSSSEYYRFFMYAQEDIEKTLAPTIRTVDFVYRPKKK